MIELLEVPLIVSDAEEAKLLFNGTGAENRQFNNTLQYFDYSISADKHIYFYIWEKNGRYENVSILDRIVHKAAFSLLVLNKAYPNLQFVIQNYKNHFKTPLLIISSMSENDYNSLAKKIKILKDEKDRVFFYNSGDRGYLDTILRHTIRSALTADPAAK